MLWFDKKNICVGIRKSDSTTYKYAVTSLILRFFIYKIGIIMPMPMPMPECFYDEKNVVTYVKGLSFKERQLKIV